MSTDEVSIAEVSVAEASIEEMQIDSGEEIFDSVQASKDQVNCFLFLSLSSFRAVCWL